MRHNQNRRSRGRNNNRKGPNPLARSYESNGPDVKVRGTAAHVAEKYTSLARDAQAAGDIVGVESYLQHAEHYNRIVMAAQAQMQQVQPQYRDGPDEGYDDDRQMNGRDRFELNGDGRGGDDEERMDGGDEEGEQRQNEQRQNQPRPQRPDDQYRQQRGPRQDRYGFRDRQDRPDNRQDRPDRQDRQDRGDRDMRGERTERPDRSDRMERPDRMDRPDRPERPEQQDSYEEREPQPQPQVFEAEAVEQEAAPNPPRRRRSRTRPEGGQDERAQEPTTDGAAALAAFRNES
jgi:hypothetical protein